MEMFFSYFEKAHLVPVFFFTLLLKSDPPDPQKFKTIKKITQKIQTTGTFYFFFTSFFSFLLTNSPPNKKKYVPFVFFVFFFTFPVSPSDSSSTTPQAQLHSVAT